MQSFELLHFLPWYIFFEHHPLNDDGPTYVAVDRWLGVTFVLPFPFVLPL